MARMRTIKPGAQKDGDIARLSPWARLLYLVGLPTLADRRGVLEDLPMWIKAEVFPHDAVEVEPLLVELAAERVYAAGPFIQRYTGRDGRRYVLIRNFPKHQRPHPDEKPSSAPLPDSSVPPPPPPPQAPPATPASPGSSGAPNGGQPANKSSQHGWPWDPTANHLPTSGEPRQAAATDGLASGQQAFNSNLGLEPEPEQRPPLSLIGDAPSAPDASPGPKEPLCVMARGDALCGRPLRRETGRFAASSPTTEGRGWHCPRRDGGCGQVYARKDIRVWRQLSDAARGAIDAEIAAERDAEADAALVGAESPDDTPENRAAFARREEYAAEFVAWLRVHRRHDERWGEAWVRWVEPKGWALWVRDRIRRDAAALDGDALDQGVSEGVLSALPAAAREAYTDTKAKAPPLPKAASK